MNEKILILGGTSYVGKRLVHKLLNNNKQVSIVSRSCHKIENHPNLEKINSERSSSLYHLKDKTWDIVYDQICFNANDAEIACTVFKGKIGAYVFTSSQAVYPKGKNLRENEFDPYNFINLSKTQKTYSYAKRQAEAILYKQASFPVTSVRFPIILGHDNPYVRLQTNLNLALKKKVVFVENKKALISLIDSSEAANFLYWLHDKSFNCPINACSLGQISLEEFIKCIEYYSKISIDTKEINFKKYTQNPYLVHVAWETHKKLLPLSITDDWYMSQEKAQYLGYVFQKLMDWIPCYLKNVINNKNSL